MTNENENEKEPEQKFIGRYICHRGIIKDNGKGGITIDWAEDEEYYVIRHFCIPATSGKGYLLCQPDESNDLQPVDYGYGGYMDHPQYGNVYLHKKGNPIDSEYCMQMIKKLEESDSDSS